MKKPFFHPLRRLLLAMRPRAGGRAVASLVLVLAVSACSKQDDTTVGQKLDTAIAKTAVAAAEAKVKAEQSAAEAKIKTEAALANAGVALKNATQKAESSIKDAAGKASEKMDDIAISSAVSSAIAKDAELSIVKINVDTRDGVVTLNGTVATQAAREKAGTLAKAIQGVHSVDNKLVVKAG